MGEQMVDRVAEYLGRKTSPCRTAVAPLLEPSEVAGISGITPPAVERAAVEHYCRNEWAEHLQDVMIRRTSWHHYFTEAPQIARQAADWMAGVLGWSEERKAEEIAAYCGICEADRACTKAAV
jgi:glycerol-3-phosphate dehydrogenase